MKEIKLEDPRYKQDHSRAKILCVIPLYIPKGRKKDYSYFVEDKFESLKKTLAAHKHFLPGVQYDILLVDNGSPEDVEYFVEQGYEIVHRENQGFGFGAFKYAWEDAPSRYDYYLFTEDDNCPAHDGWLLDILTLFNSDPEIGAVGNFIEAHGNDSVAAEVNALLNSTREYLYNFDGAFTFTSAAVLRAVDLIGGLPVFDCEPNFPRHAVVNELAFQQPILELGYKLVSYAGRNRTLIHGSELYTGDLANRGDTLAPIVNHNAGWKVPQIKEAFAWYESQT